jgi:hypothetical protein
MTRSKLTAGDWEEISNALELKAAAIERGAYDLEPEEMRRPGSETYRWAAHLRRIMLRIELQLRTKM